MHCRAKSTGVVCRPEQTASDEAKRVTWSGVALRTVRLQACRRESRNRGKSNSTQAKDSLARARVSPGSRREVGEYCSALRNRGSILTQDAVGRHRRKAIESSVVRLTATVRTPAREKQTEWKSAKAEENSAGPDRPQSVSGNGTPRWL